MIFEFNDYRSYLNSYLVKLPKNGYGEARKIASYLNVSSTFISQIFNGQKDLNLEQADVLADYLGLSSLERDFFILLIEKERSGTKKLKTYFENKILEAKKASLKLSARVQKNRTLTDEEKSVFYSSGLYSAIHLYTSTAKVGRSIDEIISRFELSRARANEIMRFLIDTGLCKEDQGCFYMTEVHTHVPQGSAHLLKHHSNWRVKAIQYSEDITPEELMYTANISVSKDDFSRLREEMVQFIKRFVDTVQKSEAEEIATFQMDFLWIKK